MDVVHLSVRVPTNNGYVTPKAMLRVEEHIAAFGAHFTMSPEGLPQAQGDRLWQVSVHNPNSVAVVRVILTRHYGFEVVDPSNSQLPGIEGLRKLLGQ